VRGIDAAQAHRQHLGFAHRQRLDLDERRDTRDVRRGAIRPASVDQSCVAGVPGGT